jgi:hypothetical protein
VTGRKNKQDEGAVILTRDEAALIRRALADCHDVITRAGASGAPSWRPCGQRPWTPRTSAARWTTSRATRPFAIDHIDFPRLGRRDS